VLPATTIELGEQSSRGAFSNRFENLTYGRMQWKRGRARRRCRRSPGTCKDSAPWTTARWGGPCCLGLFDEKGAGEHLGISVAGGLWLEHELLALLVRDHRRRGTGSGGSGDPMAVPRWLEGSDW
jgi:hypothetical protein